MKLLKLFLIVFLIFGFASCDMDYNPREGDWGQNTQGGSGGAGGVGGTGPGSGSGLLPGGGGDTGSGTGTGSGGSGIYTGTGIGSGTGTGSGGSGIYTGSGSYGTGTGSGGAAGPGTGSGTGTGSGGGTGQDPGQGQGPEPAEFRFLSLTGQRNEMYRLSLPASELNRTVSLTSNVVGFSHAMDDPRDPTAVRAHGTIWGTLHAVPVRFLFDGLQSESSLTLTSDHCIDRRVERRDADGNLIRVDIVCYPQPREQMTLPRWILVPRAEEDLPHHRVARNFNSNSLSLPGTSNFSTNYNQFKTKTFRFALANYGAGGLPAAGPSFPSAALQNLIFSHPISATFHAISRNFYEYRRIVITYPSNIQITNIRPNNRVVENFQFNQNNNSITINLYPQYEPHIGDVISFNLRAANGSQVTRRITIN